MLGSGPGITREPGRKRQGECQMDDDRRARKREEGGRREAERRGGVREGDSGGRSADSQPDGDVEAQIRKRVELRMKERAEFAGHVVAFVMVNLMLWAIWAFTSHGFPWPMFVTFGWGIGLAANAYQVYQN